MSKNQWIEENLKPGEEYAGIILGKDGKPDHHLVLLPVKPDKKLNWNQAIKWAKTTSGELPTRQEQSILFENLKEKFETAWHWSCEQDEGGTDCAWLQYFGNGSQGDGHKSNEYGARAVRRILII